MKGSTGRQDLIKKVAVYTTTTLTLLLSACGSGPTSGEWAGTVRDSAGVTIVSNPAEGLWRPDEVPAIEEILRIGQLEGAPEYQFGQIVGLDADDEGHLYVGDSQAREIRVFDASGTFLRRIGRPGSGPGELGPGGTSIFPGHGDTLVVPDLGQRRVNVFLRDGTFVRSFPIPFTQSVSVKWAVTPEAELLQQVRQVVLPGSEQEPGPDLVLRRGSDGTIQDTVLVLPAGPSVQFSSNLTPTIKLFEPEPLWEMARDGRIFLAVNSDYRIELRSLDGSVERVIQKPFRRQAVEEADREALLSLIHETFEQQGAPPSAVQRLIQGISFADHYPAFVTFFEGPEGSLWVQQVQSAREIAAAGGTLSLEDDLGAPDWDVFDHDGRFLGVVTLPPRFEPRVVRGNRIYGVQKDELDVQYVVAVEVRGGELGGD